MPPGAESLEGKSMSWEIECKRKECGEITTVANVVDLIRDHRNDRGYFRCGTCGGEGYIERQYEVTGEEDWVPTLRGALLPGLNRHGEGYSPFVFLISYGAEKPITDIWFRYYKDRREQGGELYVAAQGCPVFRWEDVMDVMSQHWLKASVR